jgi:uncharacterized BrkB/YihY/UPF0761 family membrane protein
MKKQGTWEVFGVIASIFVSAITGLGAILIQTRATTTFSIFFGIVGALLFLFILSAVFVVGGQFFKRRYEKIENNEVEKQYADLISELEQDLDHADHELLIVSTQGAEQYAEVSHS